MFIIYNNITYDELNMGITVYWHDIWYLLKYSLVSFDIIVDHAVAEVIKNDITDDIIIELACLFKPQDRSIIIQLDKLVASENKYSEAKYYHHFLYILLRYIQNLRLNEEQLRQELASIYADLDYPEELSPLIYYMPSKNPDEKYSEYDFTSKLERYLSSEAMFKLD